MCAEIKPRFYQNPIETSISATQPWQRISLDFKRPVKGKNNYLLIVIDEYSRFSFVFPCRNLTKQTVINCFMTLFCMFSLPGFVHTDHSSCFSAKFLKIFFIFRELQQAEQQLTIQQGVHKMNTGTKQFGEQSNSCCIAEDFQKKL